MDYNFFQHPMWQKYHNRPIWIITLSETEHRLRDARAILALAEFLPPKNAGTMFAAVTIGDKPATGFPKIPEDAGIVLVGRPSLFGKEIERLLKSLTPPIYYTFKSNESNTSDYRTIICPDREFKCQTFIEQKCHSPAPSELKDTAIVYSGWQGDRPVTVLSGTSTVGTWGAVQYVNSISPGNDVRWQQDVQGVVEASVHNRDEAFDSVQAKAKEMLAPVRIWMQGADLPPSDAWPGAIQHYEQTLSGPKIDLQILANGVEILKKSKDYVSGAVLLAWLDSPNRVKFDGGFSVSTTSGDLTDRLKKKFECQFDNRDTFQNRVYSTLHQLTNGIREAGGIAFKSQLRGQKGWGKSKRNYTITSRNLPFFLQSVHL
ncbi:MAG: hypothetical protein FVQ84_12420 [Planctomycetes bacterium]|nr:hypothetical protein [Planctomycetota bacterium]